MISSPLLDDTLNQIYRYAAHQKSADFWKTVAQSEPAMKAALLAISAASLALTIRPVQSLRLLSTISPYLAVATSITLFFFNRIHTFIANHQKDSEELAQKTEFLCKHLEQSSNQEGTLSTKKTRLIQAYLAYQSTVIEDLCIQTDDEATRLKNPIGYLLANILLDLNIKQGFCTIGEQEKELIRRARKALNLPEINSFSDIIDTIQEDDLKNYLKPYLENAEKELNRMQTEKQIKSQPELCAPLLSITQNMLAAKVQYLFLYALKLEVEGDECEGQGITLHSVSSEDTVEDFKEENNISQEIATPILNRSLKNHGLYLERGITDYAKFFSCSLADIGCMTLLESDLTILRFTNNAEFTLEECTSPFSEEVNLENSNPMQKIANLSRRILTAIQDSTDKQ